MKIQDIKPKVSEMISENMDAGISALRFIGGGSFGKVYKADLNNHTTVVIKLYMVDGIAKKEAESLKLLSKNKVMKIPYVYFIKEKNRSFSYDCLCMEYISGTNALFNIKLLLSSQETKKKFADSVVDGLLAVHSVKNDKFGYADNPEYNTWNEYYKPFADDIYNKALSANKAGKFDTYILEVMTAAMQKYDDIFDKNVKEAVLIHGDINVMNIMVNKSLLPEAFIDPLNSMYADREYELFQLQNLTGNCFKLYDTYKSRYKVSEKCDLKCAFYGLWNEAMVYLKTGRYTGFIMRTSVNRMKKELKKLTGDE